MSYLLSPFFNEAQIDANGDPVAGGFIYTYLAGTLTPVATFKTDSGTAHTNPIQLDAAGYYPTGTQLYLLNGLLYKFIFTDSVGVTLRTIDNVTPINDVNSTPSEWQQYLTTAFTYLSPTSFSVVGDQTNIFQVNRRVQTTNTGGTAYGTVVSAVYGAPNTVVTLANTSGALDSGLSAVYYALLSATNPSVPTISATNFTMSTARGLGRLTAGTGAVEELTATQWTASLVNTATDTAAGKIEIATAAEARARTGNFAITPGNFSDANNVTVATVATTAGTTVAITTAAPSWAQKLRLILRSGSTNGTDNWLVQIGSGGLTTTGYGGAGSRSSGAAVAVTGSTAGLLLNIAAANSSINGEILITRGDANEYIISATLADGVNAAVYSSATGVSLAGVLTHVSITTTGGANTFDAGTAVLRAE